MKHFLKSSLLIILSATLLYSCSSETEEQKPQQREIYQTQSEQIGHEAAEAIKVPMEKAEDAVDIENERIKEYEKSLQE